MWNRIGAASKVIYYNPVESWSLANVVTLAGLESAIPMPVGLNDKAGDSPTVSNLFAKDGKPHYDPSVITIAEAPPRQDQKPAESNTVCGSNTIVRESLHQPQ